MRILVMGLPGAGKTYLSKLLKEELQCAYFNADEVRTMANDWDFSVEGRLRQANRMKLYSMFEKENGRTSICDFICPTENTRTEFGADFVIWLNTINEGRFEDTNKMFEAPLDCNYLIIQKNAEEHVPKIVKKIQELMNV